MPSIDSQQLLNDIKNAANTVLSADLSSLQGFSERQLLAIAQQAVLVADGIQSGQISAATRDFFLNSLSDMVDSFNATLRGLTAAVLEQLWNSIVTTVWQAISRACGVVLTAPVSH